MHVANLFLQDIDRQRFRVILDLVTGRLKNLDSILIHPFPSDSLSKCIQISPSNNNTLIPLCANGFKALDPSGFKCVILRVCYDMTTTRRSSRLRGKPEDQPDPIQEEKIEEPKKKRTRKGLINLPWFDLPHSPTEKPVQVEFQVEVVPVVKRGRSRKKVEAVDQGKFT